MEGSTGAYVRRVTIDPESGVPVYLQLVSILRARIEAEKLRRVPSVKTLSQEYGLAHGTVEKALRVLSDAGEVYAVTGKGFYVRGTR